MSAIATIDGFEHIRRAVRLHAVDFMILYGDEPLSICTILFVVGTDARPTALGRVGLHLVADAELPVAARWRLLLLLRRRLVDLHRRGRCSTRRDVGPLARERTDSLRIVSSEFVLPGDAARCASPLPRTLRALPPT